MTGTGVSTTARPKVSVVGAGMVGAQVATLLVQRAVADVVLVDVVDGIPQGKALDISHSRPLFGSDVSIVGTNDYAATAGSDIAVITAGLPRKPGMSRSDLLRENARIVANVAGSIALHSPGAILIVVTNPLDAMVHVAHRVSGFPAERVVGMAGVLDSSRLASLVASHAKVPVGKVSCCVLGGHGDSMIPLVHHSTVSGIPLDLALPKKDVDALVARTRDSGAEIVGLLKTGSAFFAPAASIIEMVRAILDDTKQVLPCSAYLDGQYGEKGVFVGVPVRLGRRGAEGIVELSLDDAEKEAFRKTAADVRTLCAEADTILTKLAEGGDPR